ncbi:ABC transporter ATP-binding protein [Nitratireductor pacificus]|uniref:Oligopeptide/dipeptide ABC transporter ATPase n=1 Tax=Nitratireductor pacificus pht-3B TaxID=391937 RepID=K2LRR8_9HYPH|nr:oligopeptide/dipeptide ABC transporter ATP-binding protein [Nitratireductor pacificus]EKF20474.1 oligopeptide/dipeptide ABC transporter ATPase [Nitratireductor pacificus pht-3B]
MPHDLAPAPEILRVENLTKHFPIRRGAVLQRVTGTVKAVDGVSFSVPAGRTLGLVGESGCGKSTIGRLLVRLIDVTSGSIHLDGADITHLKGEELFRRRQDLQFVFQDPMSSLNPRMRVEDIVAEPLLVRGTDGVACRTRVAELLDLVGLSRGHARRFPHEFSGGQRQRIGIARALATNPRFIVCDEAVSALDVSVQAQILNLLKRLQVDLGLSYLFVAHDLSVVKHVSQEVAVMYLGRIIEIGDRRRIYASPAHPYTQALLSAVPRVGAVSRKGAGRQVLAGELPDPINPPGGCAFHTRCAHAMPRCSVERPELEHVSKGHHAACHLVG